MTNDKCPLPATQDMWTWIPLNSLAEMGKSGDWSIVVVRNGWQGRWSGDVYGPRDQGNYPITEHLKSEVFPRSMVDIEVKQAIIDMARTMWFDKTQESTMSQRSKAFVFNKVTPETFKLAKSLGIVSVGDLARLDVEAIESLRACASAAKNLIHRFPWAETLEFPTTDAKP